MDELTEPVDREHRDCVNARTEIRARFQQLRDRVAAWAPRPMPANWKRT